MAEIDASMLDAEIGITLLLVGQLLVLVIVGVFGFLAGRQRSRWVQIGFALALLIAVFVGGGTVYRCEEARDTMRGRLDGRAPGPFVSEERARAHLAVLTRYEITGVVVLVATLLGSGLVFRLGRRGGQKARVDEVW